MDPASRLQSVFSFWFSPETRANWWKKSTEFDDLIKEKFNDTFQIAKEDVDFSYEPTPETILGHIILFDQLTRNMFRGLKESFETDPQALALAKLAVEKGFDKELPADTVWCVYMPYMHSEDLSDQLEGIILFTNINSNIKYAIAHKDIIEKFGRFPHRNEILGRESTEEEIEFLSQPNSSF